MLMRRALEARMPTTINGVDISQANGVLTLAFNGGGPTLAGTPINPASAEYLPIVYACVRILADTIAQTPLLLYRDLEDGGREEAKDHPLYEMLRRLPNPEMTAFDLKATMARWLFLWGDAYAEIIRDSQGRPVALWPLRSDCMTVQRESRTGKLTYLYRQISGEMHEWVYNPDRPPLYHWKINSLDGITGRSPARVLRETMGWVKASEEYGARFYGAGSTPGGILTTDGKLDSERALRMRNDWERLHQGLDRAHRVAVFEQGLKFMPITVPPNDAQFLETQKFQRNVICDIYGVKEFMLSSESATRTVAEAEKNHFVTFTMAPHFANIAAATERDLLGRKDYERYHALFDKDDLLKGDFAQRMTGYTTGLNWGIYTVNEVRSLEGWNPRAGGDDPIAPLSTSSKANSKQSTPDAGNAVGDTTENLLAGQSNG